MSDKSLYKICISGNAPNLYPADSFFGLLYYGQDEAMEIPKLYPYSGEWGQILSTQILERDSFPMPRVIYIVWLSIVEKKFYILRDKLHFEKLENLWQQKDEVTKEDLFTHIVVGMAPYGGVAVWASGNKKSILERWHQGEETMVDMETFMGGDSQYSLEEYCDFYMNNDSGLKENIIQNGLPSRHLFDKYMQQFTYRYLYLFEHWDENNNKWNKYEQDETPPSFNYIEELLIDGTYDKLHDDRLLNYHQAGKPKKLAVKWHVRKSEYMAYFWFEDEEICAIYDKFYGAHRDTKTDFIIYIDVEKNKYELALYRYGLKEPQVIAKSVYQMIVFKNKFEYYRSENYDQPRGAWIW